MYSNITNIDSEIKKAAKIEAATIGVPLNTFVEMVLIAYFKSKEETNA